MHDIALASCTNTTYAQYSICTIITYSTCTTYTTYPQQYYHTFKTTLSLPRNLASSVLSMLILACCKPHYFHFAHVSFNITCHNINIGTTQVYNTKSYPHDTDLVYLWWLLFLIDLSWTRNLFMPFTCVSNYSSITIIPDNPFRIVR